MGSHAFLLSHFKKHTHDLTATKICSLILRNHCAEGRWEMEHWICHVEKTKDLEDCFFWRQSVKNMLKLYGND